ncbi:ATP-grasp domain-containing protein [Stappia sp. ES.058]|uniref:ATP-grasp domain-containing protein n=1 Tax=Stappia sp. ES.058 TaxID=1881061 RepID=UPI00087AEECC|nr:ATP-grasp domain-containing protein [Stappia sp. ES.058]SDU44242.1 ATP-grasp domain-containing protein [Stappia sp. ES.058]
MTDARRDAPRTRLLLVGGWPAIVEKALRAADEVVLFHGNPTEIDPALQDACRIVQPIDTQDETTCIQRARTLHRTHPFTGVIAVRDVDCMAAAGIRDALGIAGNSRASVSLTRNKISMRRALSNGPLDTVAWAAAYDRAEVRAAVARLCAASGKPVIVKPASGRGSLNVRLVSRENVEAVLATHTDAGLADGLIVERFVEGAEYSVETLSLNGHHHLLGVTEKLNPPRAPYFVEEGHLFPARLTDTVLVDIRARVFRLLDTLGITQGLCHTEIKVDEGIAHLIETHARPAGDRIWRLMELALGIDPIEIGFTALVGRPASLPETVPAVRLAAIGYVCGDGGRVSTASVDSSIHEIPGLVESRLLFQSGAMAPPTQDSYSRHAFVIITNARECALRDNLETALSRIKVLCTPVPSAVVAQRPLPPQTENARK